MKKLLYILAIMLTWVACTDEDTTYDDYSSEVTIDLSDYVTFSPTVGSTTTRGSHTTDDLTHFGFTCGGCISYDTVDVYKVALIDLIWYMDSLQKTSETTMPLFDFYDDTDHKLNYKYSYYERDTIWIGDTVMRWDSDASTSSSFNYIAVAPYPYKGQKDFLSYENPKSVAVSVDSDQTAYSDLSNDLLLCKKTSVSPTTDLSSQGEVEIEFQHAMAKLKVVVTLDTMFNTQFGMDELQKLYNEEKESNTTHIYATNATDDDIAAGKDTMKIGSYTLLTTESNPIRELSINGLQMEGTLNLSTDNPAVAASEDKAGRIYLGYDSIFGYVEPLQWSEFAQTTYEAIIVPQEVTVSDITMRLVMGYYTYEYTFTNSSFTFKAGNSYEIDLFLNPNEMDGTVTEIKPSSTNDDFTDIKVGDFLMSDGTWIENDSVEYYEGSATPVAIVFSLDGDRIGTKASAALTSKSYTAKGMAMALKNFSDTCNWQNDSTDTDLYNVTYNSYDSLKAQYDGYGSCDTIKNSTNYSETTFPAIYKALNNNTLAAPDNTTGWYLPSSGEWIDFIENLGSVERHTSTMETTYSYQKGVPTYTEISSSVFNDWMAPAGVDNYDSFGWTDCFWSSTEIERTGISTETATYAAAAYFTRNYNLIQILTHSKMVEEGEDGLNAWNYNGVKIPAMVRPCLTFGYKASESSSEAKGNTKLSEERRVKSEESPHKVKVALSPGDIKTTTW